ncbi:MAG: methylmalonyl-CoA epimerase [candidate division Zixibacteria bacterium]|nr:methylmalonyl-CoA epimerase [candidate division Zixibacteria bacterium]
MCSNSLISHVGIAVADFEEAVERYRILTGDRQPHIVEVTDQQVKVAIFSTNDSAIESIEGRIELVSPISEKSPVARFLKKKGEGLHHICIFVDNLEEKLTELKASGIRLIDEFPRIGAEGNRIAFVHPAGMNGVLIELEERLR